MKTCSLRRTINVILCIVSIFTLTACSNNEIKTTLKPFPEIQGTDFNGNTITNDIFSKYDVTVVNFWTNSCGSCIAEMPDLEEYYQEFKGKNINLIAVAASAGDSEEMKSFAQKILKEKGVTFINVIPDIGSSFYKDFIMSITGFPTTYIVDKKGNIVGAPIVGVVKNQEDIFMKRINEIVKK